MIRYLSLFSGIEAATAAWHQLGWQCVGVSEIEPFPCSALRYHYPHVPNLGDVKKAALCALYSPGNVATVAARYPSSRLAREYARVAEIMQTIALFGMDLIVFGSPCQDLSVAGKREGLDGARSGLFFAAMHIIRWARAECGLRWALWENVPGAFTSNSGRDFAEVVKHLAGLDDLDTPPKGWGTEGAAVGEQAMVEWSVLDAQWFGVAQRRRRVFALADFGDWAGRPPILLEPESLRGDSAPSRKAGEEAAAGTLRSTQGGSCVDHAIAGHLRPVVERTVVSTLDAQFGRLQGTSGQDANHGHSHLITCMAHGQGGAEIAVDRSPTLTCIHEAPIAVIPPGAVGFTCKDYGGDASVELAPTMRAMGHSESHANAGGQLAVAFPANLSGTQCASSEDLSPSLCASNPTAVAYVKATNPHSADEAPRFEQTEVSATLNGWDERHNPPKHIVVSVTGDVAHTLNTANNGKGCSEDGTGRGVPAIAYRPVTRNGYQVRRLTPRECERLQGFPDDYTQVPHRAKPAADGPRYKALGNSMAVTVMHWIGKRIDFVHVFFPSAR